MASYHKRNIKHSQKELQSNSQNPANNQTNMKPKIEKGGGN